MLAKKVLSFVRFSSSRLSSIQALSTDSPVVVSSEETIGNKKLPEKFVNERKEIFETYPLNNTVYKKRQAWVENLSSTNWIPHDSHIIDLHPEIWSVRPRYKSYQKGMCLIFQKIQIFYFFLRLDILYENASWQEQYKVMLNFLILTFFCSKHFHFFTHIFLLWV